MNELFGQPIISSQPKNKLPLIPQCPSATASFPTSRFKEQSGACPLTACPPHLGICLLRVLTWKQPKSPSAPGAFPFCFWSSAVVNKVSVPSFLKLSLLLDFRVSTHRASYPAGVHSHPPRLSPEASPSSLCSVPKLLTQSMAVKTICISNLYADNFQI